MTQGHHSSTVSIEPTPTLGVIHNLGKPLIFTDVEALAGFAKEPAKGDQDVKVLTKLALTSDEPKFHLLVENLAKFVKRIAQQVGRDIDLSRVNTLLILLRPDGTAEVWLDTAAISIKCRVKRAVAAGSFVFERDIADILSMTFPCVNFGPADKVLCVFREGWRFAFAFDMNPQGKLNVDEFGMTLGTLFRELRYKHIYDAVRSPEVLKSLRAVGWFPFVEIITTEFVHILQHLQNNFDIREIEDEIIASFNDSRMDGILERWAAKPHFAKRSGLLRAAIAAFRNKEPIAVIKIVLTEIEGILSEAYRDAHNGKSGKLNDLLSFAEASAEEKSGGATTLMLPKAFGEYLREHTFANFDPVAQTGTASSRHAVGHGAASQDSYTMTRALQAVLTLDQLAFYT